MNTIAHNDYLHSLWNYHSQNYNHKRVQDQHSCEASSPAWSKNDTKNNIFSTKNSKNSICKSHTNEKIHST